MAAIPGISKSRFTNYLQCPRLGYMSCFPSRFAALAGPFDWATLDRIETGNRAGRLACDLFPGGVLIGHVKDLSKALSETATVMADPGVNTLYEAAFASAGLLSRADILLKNPDDTVELIEVKATNEIKKKHVADVAFQIEVMERAGLAISSASLLHFNPDYVHPGGDVYDPEDLFTVEDITSKARRYQREELPGQLDAMLRQLALPDVPYVRVKNGCKGDCVYYRQVCGVGLPSHPICELGGNHPKLFAALDAAGLGSLEEIPDDFPGLAPDHYLVLQAIKSNGLHLECGTLKDLSETIPLPACFVDFETYNPGFPLYEGMRPYQHICFQWSLHFLREDGTIEHDDFLQADGLDPRRNFASALISAVEKVSPVVVYNKTMESSRLKELARDFPDLGDDLLAIDSRIVDLLDYVRLSCYHPDFHGSRSLKKVTPILAPNLSYEDLDLKGGTEAMEAYATIIAPETTGEERERLKRDLRTYCGVDTLATVEIYKRLSREAQLS